ncbi:MAG: type II secretion system F family protein [Rickettsiales bacterium]
MTPILIALAVGLLAYIAFILIFPKKTQTSERTQHALRRIMEENVSLESGEQRENILKDDFSNNIGIKVISKIPVYGERYASLILKSGMEKKAGIVLLVMLAIFLVGGFAIATTKLGVVGFVISLAAALYLPARYMQGRIRKRNGQFINDFPDVLDMIVRSVRSGFPLNTAINMVAENMDPPVSTEFRQVAEEMALGRPLDAALTRLSHRIDEQDIHFFVVVLKVQQETGGNLAEIISNLSTIIRKRKQLRLKIRAITSEGRITGWILGAIPISVFFILLFFAPNHLDPLFDTHTGNIMLGLACGMVIATFFIVKKMLEIDI